MIISQTPFRISFFGGGTDYPVWFREHEGAVLSTTIDKYCYLSCRLLPAFFPYKHRIVYSQIETVNELEQIQHPAVREVLRYLKIDKGLEIHHTADLPARSGLGSSSSFTVGLLNALFALNGEVFSKKKLARTAIHIEQDLIQETVGSQDQVSVALGGLNHILFHQDGSFNAVPIVLKKERRSELENSLILFFTGVSRVASEIAETQISNINQWTKELKSIHSLVGEAIRLLQGQSFHIKEFGRLLNESWQIKRCLSPKISNPQIDEIYCEGLKAGAFGGKVLGAGGGGFILFCAPPEHHASLCERLRGLTPVFIKFENHGARIVLYDPHLGEERESQSDLPTFRTRIAHDPNLQEFLNQ